MRNHDSDSTQGTADQSRARRSSPLSVAVLVLAVSGALTIAGAGGRLDVLADPEGCRATDTGSDPRGLPA